MRLLDAFFATRPLLLIPAWSFFLLGHVSSNANDFPALRLLLFTLILIATHLLNQVVDLETDRRNNKGYFLQRGVFSAREYVGAAALLLSVALGVSWAQRNANILLSLAALLGLAYNLRPLRLSHRPIVDLMANAFGYGGIAYLLAQPMNRRDDLAMQLVATICAVAAVCLHTTLLDADGDRREGKRTTGVFLGHRLTRILSGVFAFIALLAAWMTSLPILWGPCLMLTALTWFAGSQRIAVWGTASFAVAASIAFWWFGIAMALLLLMTRIYYSRRFDLRYPSF